MKENNSLLSCYPTVYTTVLTLRILVQYEKEKKILNEITIAHGSLARTLAKMNKVITSE